MCGVLCTFCDGSACMRGMRESCSPNRLQSVPNGAGKEGREAGGGARGSRRGRHMTRPSSCLFWRTARTARRASS